MAILYSLANIDSVFQLSRKTVNSVGKSQECSVKLPYPTVSSQHAEIYFTEPFFYVKDLFSSCGSTVNGDIVKKDGKLLFNNDIICFGSEEYVFRYRSNNFDYEKIPRETIEHHAKNLNSRYEHNLNLMGEVFRIHSIVARMKVNPTDTARSCEHIYADIIKAIKNNYNILKAVILIQDSETEILSPVCSFAHKNAETGSRISHSISLKTFNSKTMVFTTDAQKDANFKDKLSVIKYNIKSVLSLPILFQNVAAGVLYIETNRNLQSFHRDDINFFEILASAAGQVAGSFNIQQKALQKSTSLETMQQEITDIESGQMQISGIVSIDQIPSAPESFSVSKSILIELSPDGFSATARIDKSSPGVPTYAAVIEELRKHNITEGICEENIRKLLDDPEITCIEVAHISEESILESVDLLLNTKKSPAELFNDSQMHSFDPVTANAPLMRLHKESPVKKLTGESVSDSAYFDSFLGINTRLKNDTVIASIFGRPVIFNRKIHVIPVFAIKGNLDHTIGNINFNGDVNIQGRILVNGLSIEAYHDIICDSSFEVIKICSKYGNIFARGHITGKNKTILNSAENITAKSLFETIAVCRGDCTISENITDSFLTVYKKLTAGSEKQGNIIGGNILCGSQIECKNLGNSDNVPTQISVDPVRILQKIEKDKHEKLEYLAMKREIRDKFRPVIEKIKSSASNIDKLPSKNQILLKEQLKRFENLEFTIEIMESYRLFIENAASDIRKSQPEIIVYGSVFPNVTIQLGTASMTTETLLQHVRIYLKDKEIAIEKLS